jgi:hypothetical protein
MIFITSAVHIQSEKSLEEVAGILSKELFNGLTFGGKEEYVLEEVPAVYIEGGIMGLAVILGGENGYFSLSMYPYDYPAERISSVDVDLTEYLSFLLGNTREIRVMTSTEVEEYQNKFE